MNISESSIRELNLFDLWVLQPLQFMSSIFLMFSICYEPYTLLLIKYNFCPQKKVKKSVKNKIRGIRNLSSYFQSSLSYEIIYTILNAVKQQLEDENAGVIMKKKSKQIQRINSMVSDSKMQQSNYLNMDYHDEKIMRMDNQVLQNLD